MEAVLDLVSKRPALWWVNEAGIVLEIIGAAILVAAAFKTRREIRSISDTWDAKLPERLRDTLAAQAFTELAGFVLLAIGLVCQMIGALDA